VKLDFERSLTVALFTHGCLRRISGVVDIFARSIRSVLFARLISLAVES